MNPSHLFLGTAAVNNRDAQVKGRTATGERASNAKLTDEQVREIKRRLAMGHLQADLAAEYLVTRATITHIKTGRTWKSV